MIAWEAFLCLRQLLYQQQGMKVLFRRTRKEFKKKTINCTCTEPIREQMSVRDLETQARTWAEFGDEVWGDQNCSDLHSE